MSWSKRPITWRQGGVLHISVVFTWQLEEVRRYCESLPEKPIVGGPAVRLMPSYLAEVAYVRWDAPQALSMHNVEATRTTVGCPNGCAFCGVRMIEPEYRELDNWLRLPIVCDNNLLAASMKHFDKVIESLKGIRGVDFNQGLDARLLTRYHAERLSCLHCKPRIAWDHTRDEREVMRAIEYLQKAGFTARNIGCYVLFGFDDSPDDALYRFEALKRLGIRPNAMRYQPLDALKKNSYVAPGWNERLLRDMSKYWNRQAWLGGIPFKDFRYQECGR